MDELVEMGDRVKDKVTGFEGTVTARVVYLNGCVQFCVDPGIDKDGKTQDHHYIDEGQLSVVEKNACSLPQMFTEEGPPGGVMSNTPPK